MRLLKPRTILLGGLAVAAVAGALKNREKVAGLIGVRSSAPEPWAPSAPASPPPANADLPHEESGASARPVATYDGPDAAAEDATGTAASEAAAGASAEVQALLDEDEDQGGSGIDEAAEEAAAAAEAAAIGGPTPSYAGLEFGETASEEERAVIEAGGGESEGLEQSEADLVSNVETNIGEPQPGYARIADAIQAEDSPGRWEQVEGLASHEPDAAGEPERQTASQPILSSQQETEAPAATELPGAETEAASQPELPGAETEAASQTELPGATTEAPTGDIETPEEDSGISSAPSWGERFRARVRERDEQRARESGIVPGPGADGDDEPAEPAGEPEAASPAAEPPAAETPAEEKSGAVWREDAPKPADAVEEPSGSLLARDEQPTVEAESLKPEGGEDDDSEWQTWSGRAVEP